jgi:Amt family ammonium transporter
VHGVGGIMGTLLLAVFGTATFGGTGVAGMGSQLLIQAKAVGFVALWSAVGTALIILVVRSTVGLRVNQEAENIGLDRAEHGETAYHLD